LLERRGHRVELATTGLQALQRIEGESFDLLLLDLHMPELDGFQVIERLRARERSSGGHLPVIAITARLRDQDRARCLAAGMDGFLTKPISADGLWSAIARLVPVVRRESTDLLTPDVILAACGADATLLAKLCETFRTRLPTDLSELESALAERDASKLREHAHKFTAMLATFSTEAGELASAIEPLVARLRTMSNELIRQVEHVSIETLRRATRT
jgi:CheY-like chemotaxis protein